MIYQYLKPYLERSNFLKKFDNTLLQQEKGVLFYQLNLTTKALLSARIFDLQQLKKNVLFITSEDNRAEEIVDDLVLLSGHDNIVFIPDFETLPYEDRSPHFSIRAQRIEGMSRLLNGKSHIIVVSIKNLLRIIVPPRLLRDNIITLKLGNDYKIEQLCSKLVSVGYKIESEVSQVGDFARRGGIIDIFSPANKLPVRLEFFGDTIDSCRFFDPQTQRSTGGKREIYTVLPVREVFLDDITTTDSQLWEKLHNTGLYEGIEQDVSLLYKETATISDYVSLEDTVTVFDEYQFLENIAEELYEETADLYLKRLKEISQKKKSARQEIPLPEQIYSNLDSFVKKISSHSYYFLSAFLQQHKLIKSSQMSSFSSQSSMNGELNILRKVLDSKISEGWQIIIQSDNISQSKRMQELLVDQEDKIEFSIGVLHRGFNIEDAKLALFTDHEIFNRYKQKRFQEYFATGETIIDYETLNPGDYIVHVDHGIGIYEGLKLMQVNGINIECLSIRYAEDARVYVPTFQLQLVNRFVADEGVKPEISKLGSKRWDAVKNRAKKQIELIADDLVRLYAERQARTGISCETDSVWQNDLESSFIYEDTPDQRRATEEIKTDMEQVKPMERLLCGDVGFGKTEVAIRAAFKAITSGWQVAVLVPTTLLAEQHYLVFRERLAQYPVNIAMFSRFRTAKHLKEDVKKIGTGEIDIAIGTHRLFSKDIKFKKLGLLIIDEEHRFGVRHKETLRKLKVNVDTLYMSATPIPRTLSMALAKFKEMSLMQTSPKARLPIRTVIIPYDRGIIKDAILRELERGGQILFLHNRVETIDSIADELRELLPKVRIAVGHGQLPERLLEKVMLDFYDKQFDVLVATTIIESGIDIPNANTIIINRSDMFGLAQLYQLRGRVGRSNRRAYAYFIIPKHLKDEARKRLEALTEYNALGSGYQIAMRDLELRGAGTLLGTKQSGVIQAIGFNYYNKLLSEAVSNLLPVAEELASSSSEAATPMKWKKDFIGQAKKCFPRLASGDIRPSSKPMIWEDEKVKYKERLQIDADFFFPANFIKDERIRLEFYQRMLDFEDVHEFNDLEEELRDRFGSIPEPAQRGIKFYRLRLLAKKVNLEGFQIKKGRILIEFAHNFIPSQQKIEKMIKKIKYPVDFDASGKRLKMSISLTDLETKPVTKRQSEQLFNYAEGILLLLAEVT
ncbi:MAG: transcription-repair coupling factor [Candidatus Cloacimonetes bacterium]|nr:transcription-repair coupling factor [Candidatus Cloacimonadota bacterium]